ncbi:hypothetical protein L202_07654 [Cryptococcus amylolentus CBS 6039]|uniref:Uncharacterized protein n=1 Tax=Cryptococcus amylolentus CBS 6039 TaxID=1295533 RepID=A0A1E3HCY5_9TREE|nr:hypothetical protein L202_07654 [Cryptococcus amylolentus CBS 6039]ODN74208.1 hypothetical protein L202_07654 [Cryptococcus amylolentus CBS 6039]
MFEINGTTPSTYHSFEPFDDLPDSQADEASMTEDKITATTRHSTPTTPNNEENSSPSGEPSESSEHSTDTFDSVYFQYTSAEEQSRSTYHSFVPLNSYPAFKNDDNYNTAEDLVNHLVNA